MAGKSLAGGRDERARPPGDGAPRGRRCGESTRPSRGSQVCHQSGIKSTRTLGAASRALQGELNGWLPSRQGTELGSRPPGQSSTAPRGPGTRNTRRRATAGQACSAVQALRCYLVVVGVGRVGSDEGRGGGSEMRSWVRCGGYTLATQRRSKAHFTLTYNAFKWRPVK